MPVDIHQDVIVVAVLDIEVVLDKGVACQTLDEVCQAGLPV